MAAALLVESSNDLVTFLDTLIVGFRPSFYVSDDQRIREADLVWNHTLHIRLDSPFNAA